jgi:hypothetical protein
MMKLEVKTLLVGIMIVRAMCIHAVEIGRRIEVEEVRNRREEMWDPFCEQTERGSV